MQDNSPAAFWLPAELARDAPKYLAIAQALSADIRSGRLAAGVQLPPQRQLAKALGVDLTTVTRAFNEVRRAGLVEGNTKRGTIVSPSRTVPARIIVDEHRPAEATALIDLSMNMPPQPVEAGLREAIAEGIATVLASPHALARLHYQDNAGIPGDRAAGARFLAPRLGPVAPERLVVTSGSQAALFAVVSALLEPGSVLAAPEVTYPGLRSVAARCGVKLAAVRTDQNGLLPDDFEALCRANRPKALYCVPTLDNPTTATLPAERRQALVAIARRYDVAFIEDDAYGALPEHAPAPLAALAPERSWHVATLSKCATPALRLAYVATPGQAEALEITAQTRIINLMAPPLMSGLATAWIKDGTMAHLTSAIRRENHARQAIAATALNGFTYRAAADAHHLWLSLPTAWVGADLSAVARKAGLALVGSAAFAVGAPPPALRISLGAAPSHDALRQGLNTLAALLSVPPEGVPGIV
ncbi:PLP-dependent aminotransferase family protein [Labrys neptuniae]|uniref:aminotransferase-like domain-containing protein n=1 Tax=Labrys neptuniae TaxID=376174 RepID=UPI0028911EB0|nr:PLP-dependent aminotransferase family protein [Labrys neptuniae]MDT3381833.1 PLP-dependent aminotransferase family protein [Labrys neptuniae]